MDCECGNKSDHYSGSVHVEENLGLWSGVGKGEERARLAHSRLFELARLEAGALLDVLTVTNSVCCPFIVGQR